MTLAPWAQPHLGGGAEKGGWERDCLTWEAVKEGGSACRRSCVGDEAARGGGLSPLAPPRFGPGKPFNTLVIKKLGFRQGGKGGGGEARTRRRATWLCRPNCRRVHPMWCLLRVLIRAAPRRRTACDAATSGGVARNMPPARPALGPTCSVAGYSLY